MCREATSNELRVSKLLTLAGKAVFKTPCVRMSTWHVSLCPLGLPLSIIVLTRSHEQLRVDVHRDRTESHRDSSDSGELVRNEN